MKSTSKSFERSRFIESTVNHIKKRIPVLVGTMNAHTPLAVHYSEEAESLGEDALAASKLLKVLVSSTNVSVPL